MPKTHNTKFKIVALSKLCTYKTNVVTKYRILFGKNIYFCFKEDFMRTYTYAYGFLNVVQIVPSVKNTDIFFNLPLVTQIKFFFVGF